MILESPKGLLLYGEVGTGKSMLIDLFADCLPSKKKKRWHYNAFMLETFAKLERLRRNPSSVADEYSLLHLARDLIESSPILFLDEFQLPDRTAAKIISNLMTAFFRLGGVLIATSNRMPDELAKAAGIEFANPPSRLESVRWRFGRRGDPRRGGNIFAGQEEYTDFLALLRARCDVWEMEGGRDYRRSETENSEKPDSEIVAQAVKDDAAPDQPIVGVLSSNGAFHVGSRNTKAPDYYFIEPAPGQNEASLDDWVQSLTEAQHSAAGLEKPVFWTPTVIKVYGRKVPIPRSLNGVASFTFAELCGSQLGPADYITLAATFHTVILTQVPTLTTLFKNEARRFITLLDALYEARCKLLISAAAGPDDLFFPEIHQEAKSFDEEATGSQDQDTVYPETFSEIYQDVNAPFRPNVSPYRGASRTPDYSGARLQGVLAEDALEDQPPHPLWRRSNSNGLADRQHLEREQFEVRQTPNFVQTGAFTGEDERFAYKRAASRLWEMCGKKWWDRNDEGWWRPVPKEMRSWERDADTEVTTASMDDKAAPLGSGEGTLSSRGISGKEDEALFRHGASPFRTAPEPPPKISWTHVWGTVKWGKKAGAWGQGVEGLKPRKSSQDK